MAFSLAEVQEIRDKYFAALLAVIDGKEYSISTGASSRTFKRNDIDEIEKWLKYWDLELTKIQTGRRGIPIKQGTPIR